SARVYAPLVRFCASSLLGFTVDTGALLGLHALTGALLPSVVGARLCSSTVNFIVNRQWVFGGRSRSVRHEAGRYLALAATLLAANYALIAALTAQHVPLLPAKLLTDATLFIASYLVQRRLVFPTGPSSIESRR